MSNAQQEQTLEKIDQLEQKINVFNENAEKLGEQGRLEEVENVMAEVEKFKKQKAELEALLDQTQEKADQKMKVCEVCGALQSASDTEKRLTMHLEGKLHTGYLKIRNKLNELKSRRDGRRGGRDGRRRRSRSRSRSPRNSRIHPRDARDARDEARRMQQLEECYANKTMYSSKLSGSGANMVSKQHSDIKFSEIALQQNKGYSGNEIQMGITSLGKEWRYYKK